MAIGALQKGCVAMTGEVCKALEKTVGIAPADTYVTYAEVENWGWNGRNF